MTTKERQNVRIVPIPARMFSNSLWQVDWHEIKDHRWRNKWLIAYQDDASRFVTGFTFQEHATSDISGSTLEQAIADNGKPARLRVYRKSHFERIESERREEGITEVEKCILKHKIKLTLDEKVEGVRYGKIAKLFSLFERTSKYFQSVNEFVHWYNSLRPHGSLGLLTPLQAFHRKTAYVEVITYPNYLEQSALELSQSTI
jgi:putative transposase